jgi:flagellar biosynthesis protein FliQ
MNLTAMIERVVVGIIAVVLWVSIGVGMGPTLLSATGLINATTLSGVPLADTIVLLGTWIGAFYYLGLALGAILMIWAVVNFNG